MTSLDRPLTPEDLRFNPPSFPAEELLDVASKRFGVTGRLAPLEGERDQNHRLTADEGRQFVLKVSGPTEDPTVVDFQIQALLHLERTDPGLPVPRVQRTLEGTTSDEIRGEDGTRHLVRLLSYLPGVPYERGPAPSLEGLRAIGAFQARMCRALCSFSHPAARHFMPWDVSNGLVFNASLWRNAGSDVRDLARGFGTDARRRVLPALAQLRAQVIHNDCHTANLLRPDETSEEIVGLIDFGDMVHAPLVQDLAASIAGFVEGRAAPIEVACALVAGFHEVLPLQDAELALLHELVLLRLVLTALLFDFRLATQPRPPAFLRETRPAILAALRALIAMDRETMTRRYREACTMAGETRDPRA
jgi:Ser/Thr protein kinase RdoA (MazF antagonist)